MGNATSLFNLMRNIGGSIGIATSGTLLSRRSQAYTAVIGAHVSGYTAQTQSMMSQMQAAFMAAGADVVTATRRAEAAIFGMVQRQATMVAFVSIFQLMAIVFFAMVPLVLLMRRPRGRAGHSAAAH
jgi:DHA2 family multidrug resistance protein